MIQCSNQLIVINNYSNITSNSKNRIEFVRDEISKIKVDVNDGNRSDCWRDYCGFDKVSARDLPCDTSVLRSSVLFQACLIFKVLFYLQPFDIH